ncbi:hypothetical protein T439DRAFT_351740 [Meredithblackwellia eburnea MCA 4105]
MNPSLSLGYYGRTSAQRARNDLPRTQQERLKASESTGTHPQRTPHLDERERRKQERAEERENTAQVKAQRDQRRKLAFKCPAHKLGCTKTFETYAKAGDHSYYYAKKEEREQDKGGVHGKHRREKGQRKWQEEAVSRRNAAQEHAELQAKRRQLQDAADHAEAGPGTLLVSVRNENETVSRRLELYKKRWMELKKDELRLLQIKVQNFNEPVTKDTELTMKNLQDRINKNKSLNAHIFSTHKKEEFPLGGDDENMWYGLDDVERAEAKGLVSQKRQFETELTALRRQQKRAWVERQNEERKLQRKAKGHTRQAASSVSKVAEGTDQELKENPLSMELLTDGSSRNIPSGFEYDLSIQCAVLPNTPIKLQLKEDGFWWLVEGAEYAQVHGFKIDWFVDKGILLDDSDFSILHALPAHIIENLARYKAIRRKHHSRMLQVIRGLE